MDPNSQASKLAPAAFLAVAAVATAVGLWLADPDRPLRAVERQLRTDQVVTLIGETRPPKWFRWRLNPGQVFTEGPPSEKPFAIQALTPTIAELVPDPQQDNYRFQAEIRHDMGELTSEVGLVFGVKKRGPVTRFWTVTLNDKVDFRALLSGMGSVGPKAWGNPRTVSIQVWDQQKPNMTSRLVVTADPLRVTPTPGEPRPWRKLAVEIGPERIKVFWDDAPLKELSQDEVTRADEWAQKFGQGWKLDGISPWLEPRGGLGLYMAAGRASFRRVTVEPLGNGGH